MKGKMSDTRARKHKDTLPNGRNQNGAPKFENWHCRIFPKDMAYPAWRYLSKTASDIANICRAKNDYAGACKRKGENGKPIFEFTATEAERTFLIPRPTFSHAIKSLIEIGFIEVARHGGTLDGKGISALYRLSEKWKEWTPPPRDNTNILKARAARGKHGGYG
jgi:DNA-binding transcriptional ArsR family regulator